MTVFAECYGEDQERVINVRAQAQMVPFIILQKALQENNDNDTHVTIKMRHT